MSYAGVVTEFAASQTDPLVGRQDSCVEQPVRASGDWQVSPPKYFDVATFPCRSLEYATSTSVTLSLTFEAVAPSPRRTRRAVRKPFEAKQLSVREVCEFSFVHWSVKVPRIQLSQELNPKYDP